MRASSLRSSASGGRGGSDDRGAFEKVLRRGVRTAGDHDFAKHAFCL
jgi:hypothetical protein